MAALIGRSGEDLILSPLRTETLQLAQTRTGQMYWFSTDLTAMLEASPSVEKGSALVRLTSFGDSSINLLVSAYLLTNQAGTFLQMQNDLNLNVMDVMQKNNVDFAFPSTTVYLSQ